MLGACTFTGEGDPTGRDTDSGREPDAELIEETREIARVACSSLPFRRSAEIAADPERVAEVHAQGYRPELRQAAKSGCLEGINAG